MQIELKPFQTEAVAFLLDELVWAKNEFVDRKKLQAVVLAAPTGSGKTVMATALVEAIVFGSEHQLSDPSAVFLWLSDRPQLNKQSREKMIAASELLSEDRLVEVDADFDAETFSEGKVYFLNTQKLGNEKLLTTSGDNRTWTIWETIQNTARLKPTSFYLILDEAHRGLGSTKSSANDGLQPTVVQKFLTGSEGELSPVPLVIGISATPARFHRLLEADSTRQVRNVTVEPAKVRESGLLKDRVVVYHPAEASQQTGAAEFSLLAEATREWLRLSEVWRQYCDAEGIPEVQPALIVQVEDGGSGITSRTDLARVVQTIESVAGVLPLGAFRHCFDTEAPLEIGTRFIEKVEASRIQSSTDVKVVFFKTSLSTGWDCPRAEVMMSFRKVQDATLIAQLIGRMVRTPLARRVSGDDILNSVGLFLPHYDSQALNNVIAHLKRDAESASATDVELKETIQTLSRSLWSEDAFGALERVPTYKLDRGKRLQPVKRLLRLAFYISQSQIDESAFESAQLELLHVLDDCRVTLQKSDIDFENKVALADKVKVAGWEFARGEWNILDKKVRTVPLTEDSLDLLFKKAASRLCGPGEGLASKYFRRRAVADDFDGDYVRPKLEFILIAEDPSCVALVERTAESAFSKLYNLHRAGIRSLKDEVRQEVEDLRARGKIPEPVDLKLWQTIIVPTPNPNVASTSVPGHLYVDHSSGRPQIALSAWEEAAIKHARAKPDFVAWLRNFAKKEWSLSIPYVDNGEYRPHFPDLLVVKESSGSLLVDVLEPHAVHHLGDSWAKAKGMTDYARLHSYTQTSSVGSVVMQTIDEVRGSVLSLDFSRVDVQAEMLQVTSREAFINLFDRLKLVEQIGHVNTLGEHQCVRLIRDLTIENTQLVAGTKGVIVSVYDDYQAYEVEFPETPSGTMVVTLLQSQIISDK